MTHNNYELNIYSLDDKAEGKCFKKYNIDGQNTIGVYENEPFEIRLKNNTFNRIQAIISLDGLNIINGNLARTSSDEQMWVVEPYNTLRITAYPETMSGGSRFVFTQNKKSVAVNTHGNTGSRGIIAAAIFVEDQTWQWKDSHTCSCKHTCICHPIFIPWGTIYPKTYPVIPIIPDVIWCDSNINSDSTVFGSNVLFSANVSNSSTQELKPLEKSAPGIGAGEYVSQTITKTAGLQRPKLDTTISIKYEWWKILRSNLYKQNISTPNGFPGDNDKFINLKAVPKVKSTAKRRRNIRQQSSQLERFV